MSADATIEPGTLVTIRRVLMFALLTGMLGTGLELLLLGHFDSAWQILPLVLLAFATVVAVWQALAPSASSLRAFQALMVLFLLAGAVGVGLHYSGNAAFELEMYPSLGGLALVGGTLTGATPVFAPGTMVLLGLVGLAYAYRHPARSAAAGAAPLFKEASK
jgi:hypothetical protein